MYTKSKYSEKDNSKIRYTIMSALQELAKFNGADINKIKTSAPYSFVLGEVTTQKISVELNKMVSLGLVVKGVAKGKTVKYMLKGVFDNLVADGKLDPEEFGYGDYRDKGKRERENRERKEEERQELIRRIERNHSRALSPMW